MFALIAEAHFSTEILFLVNKQYNITSSQNSVLGLEASYQHAVCDEVRVIVNNLLLAHRQLTVVTNSCMFAHKDRHPIDTY